MPDPARGASPRESPLEASFRRIHRSATASMSADRLATALAPRPRIGEGGHLEGELRQESCCICPRGGTYLPHHFGAHFSRNAFIPSCASAAAAFIAITSCA